MTGNLTPEPLGRRQFLQSGLAALAGTAASSLRAQAAPAGPAAATMAATPTTAPPPAPPPASPLLHPLAVHGDAHSPRRQYDRYFLPILAGFLRNARQTDPTYAVCDFPGGTLLKSCTTPSGRTYVSTARMLPAMAAWVRGGHGAAPVEVEGGSPDLRQVLLSIYRHAFDPQHPNFWGNANPKKADQRQVEASLVAHSLWVLGDDFLRELSSADRANIQAWLASCTVVAEHKHNHAWFSALNQVVRLDLATRWPEFQGSGEWMDADLGALDAMAVPGGQGWYNDYPGYEVYDWYNSWAYVSHFLLWNEVGGERYPKWRERFQSRLAEFLEHSPDFFAGNGSPVLFGRSLIYRWGAVTGLVLAYLQGQWPHSPGLLRRIVRRNLDFFWNAGAFDESLGKLRETFAPGSSPGIRERYIDNGHPYWAMQAFSLFRLPETDPFWTAPEELLPVERGDFVRRYPALGMTVVGCRDSGQVRWLSSRNNHKPAYRDKYIKFSYSSHFPFNVVDDPDRCPWDSTLVFRDPATGVSAGRAEVIRGELLPDGTLLTEWAAVLGACRFEIVSRVRPFGEFEERSHAVRVPAAAVDAGLEVVEGGWSLGLAEGEEPAVEQGEGWLSLHHPGRGDRIVTRNLSGYEQLEVSRDLGAAAGTPTNVLYPGTAVPTLRRRIDRDFLQLLSLHYASPKPKPLAELLGESV